MASNLKCMLPDPSTVLRKLNIVTEKVNGAGFFILACPFHKNGKEKNPSLNLHYIEGYYLCHACGEKGGNILDFYRAVTNKGFIEAIYDLAMFRSM